MSRRQEVLSGIKSQNEQAEFEGRKGFWIQSDCVFIEASDPFWAILKFRADMESNKIGCSHNFGCSAIYESILAKHITTEQYREARKEILL